VFEWALKHKDKSTATLNHILAKDVPILHHAMERIDVMDIKNLNLAMAQYYETLDDYTKMEAGIAFGLMQITVKQTARVFYTELEGVVSAFEEMGCPLTQQIQKHIYLHTCYELYPEKLEKATQGWVFNSNMDLPGVRVEVEKILINDNIDSSFSTEFTTDLEKRENRVDRVQKFRQLGIICNKVDTKFYGKKEEEKVMSAFHAQSQVNLSLSKPALHEKGGEKPYGKAMQIQ
jgi:ABC-type phosphate transport system auxiliary subunit